MSDDHEHYTMTFPISPTGELLDPKERIAEVRRRQQDTTQEVTAVMVSREPEECGICGDYTAQGVEVHAVCLDQLQAAIQKWMTYAKDPKNPQMKGEWHDGYRQGWVAAYTLLEGMLAEKP